MARLFIGVWPSAEVGTALDALHRPAVAGLRWTTADQWHVTLRFCGEVPDEDVAALARTVGAALRDHPPVRAASAAATEHFDGRILHLPVTGLDALAAEVGAASAGFGDVHDDRAFHGHLTLARARRPLPDALVGVPVAPTGWTVTDVAVVSTTRHPDGARYRTEALLPLAG